MEKSRPNREEVSLTEKRELTPTQSLLFGLLSTEGISVAEWKLPSNRD